MKRKLGTNRKQKYMEKTGLDRNTLGMAAERALGNYRAAGLVNPGDDVIRLIEWRVKIRKWLGEPERRPS